MAYTTHCPLGTAGMLQIRAELERKEGGQLIYLKMNFGDFNKGDLGKFNDMIRTVFLEVDQEQTGVIIADQVVTIIKNLTGDFLYHQFKEAIGTDLEDVGELNYDKVKEIIGLYINQSKPNQWGRLCTRTEGPIGIDTLPYQIQKKAMQHGFSLNMMLVGSSGLGKSTMQNTLFKSHVSRTERHTSSMAIPQTVEICSATHSLEESGTQLKLTIIDTPGFGDHMNNSK
eukprot:Ihof_evm9s19 gene=Ihof_evmTU9s19